jgi:hypothetical protein
VKAFENTFTTPQNKEDDGLSYNFREDLESPKECRLRVGVAHFALRGEGELTATGCTFRFGGLSTTPSSIIFVEQSIVEFAVAAE